MFDVLNIKKIDISLVLTMLILCIIGALNVFATTYFPDKTTSRFFFNQLLFYAIGFVIFLLISAFDYSKMKSKYFIFGVYLFTIALLIAVLLFGDYAFEAKRWIVVGPFTIQPSEFAKLSIILISAFAFTKSNSKKFESIKNIYKLKGKTRSEKLSFLFANKAFIRVSFSIISLISIIFLIILQKSLGNSVIILIIFSSLVFFTVNISIKTVIYSLISLITLNFSFHFLGFLDIQKQFGSNLDIDIILLVLSSFAILYLAKKFYLKTYIVVFVCALFLVSQPVLAFIYNNVLLPYQRNRIETFLSPDPNESLSDNYNKEQAILAVGSGGIVGRGFLNGNVTNLGLLPFAFTDFAFASYAEQFGFIGNLFLFALFFFLIFKIFTIGRNTRSAFGMLICTGVGVMICLNTFQHIGMNLGLLPITGVPLPFISYGGSAVLVIFIGLGLVQSVSIKAETEEEDVVNIKDEMKF